MKTIKCVTCDGTGKWEVIEAPMNEKHRKLKTYVPCQNCNGTGKIEEVKSKKEEKEVE